MNIQKKVTNYDSNIKEYNRLENSNNDKIYSSNQPTPLEKEC